jgi:hypothetical protein
VRELRDRLSHRDDIRFLEASLTTLAFSEFVGIHLARDEERWDGVEVAATNGGQEICGSWPTCSEGHCGSTATSGEAFGHEASTLLMMHAYYRERFIRVESVQ